MLKGCMNLKKGILLVILFKARGSETRDLKETLNHTHGIVITTAPVLSVRTLKTVMMGRSVSCKLRKRFLSLKTFDKVFCSLDGSGEGLCCDEIDE